MFGYELYLLSFEVLHTLFKLLIFRLVSLPQLLQHLEEGENINHYTNKLTLIYFMTTR